MRTSPALRAPGTRSPTLSPARKAARRGHPEPARPPSQSSSAARTLPTRSAKVHCEARPERRPRSGLPRPQPGRAPPPQPPPALPRASRAHPGSPSPAVRAARTPPSPCARSATRQVQLCWPVASGGLRLGGEPPTGSGAAPARLPAPLIRRASRGALAARCRRRRRRAGRVCGPAPAHVPTSRPPGRAHGPGRERASAHAPCCLPPREAAAQRAGGRARTRGGARRQPRGPPAPVPSGRSCVPPPSPPPPLGAGAAEPLGAPWAGVGPLRREDLSP